MMKLLLALIMSITLAAHAAADENPGEAGHGGEQRHEHTAPHGGTLVVLGDEFAHLELVLDGVTGKFTAYVLDGEAENPVRLEQEEIEIKIGTGGKYNITLRLKAVPNVLTGETAGDSSEFTTRAGKLRSVPRFDAVIPVITVRGKRFEDVEFRFPEGNE